MPKAKTAHTTTIPRKAHRSSSVVVQLNDFRRPSLVEAEISRLMRAAAQLLDQAARLRSEGAARSARGEGARA